MTPEVVYQPRPDRTEMILDSMRETLQAGPDTATLVMLGVGTVSFVVLLIMLARSFGERQALQPPDYLLMVCDQLGLDRSTRRLLKRVGQAAGMSEPVAMLVTPVNLATAAERASRVLPDRLLLERMDALCRMLHDTPLPTSEGLREAGSTEAASA